MWRCEIEKIARQIATREKLSYGWSVLSPGGWYVGTPEQLQPIGVPEIINPQACCSRHANDWRSSE